MKTGGNTQYSVKEMGEKLKQSTQPTKQKSFLILVEISAFLHNTSTSTFKTKMSTLCLT